MIDYIETLHYYVLLLKASEPDTIHNLIVWYQDNCRFYADEFPYQIELGRALKIYYEGWGESRFLLVNNKEEEE